MYRRWLVDYLIGAATTGKCVWFGFEGKAHTQYVTHGFTECEVTFELGVGVDVCMDFHVYVVFCEHVTEFVGDLNAFGDFYKHAFFDAVGVAGFFIVNEHESAVAFAKEYDDGSEFGVCAFDLGVSADAYFEVKAFGGFVDDGLADFVLNGQLDLFAVESSPFHDDMYD